MTTVLSRRVADAILPHSFTSPRKPIDRKLASALIGLVITGCLRRLGPGARHRPVRCSTPSGKSVPPLLVVLGNEAEVLADAEHVEAPEQVLELIG